MLPLKIHIPNFAKPEISYALHCLFEEFLGIAIKIEEQEHREHITVFGSKKNLEIRNHFFKSDKVENHYSPENVPTSISEQQYGKISCICLFGEAILVEKEDTLILHNDIISATFFMLSRWEEYAIKDRDAHGRFDFTKALSVKLDFYQRPVVNEWVELLWSLLVEISPGLVRKERVFNTHFSSDIDELAKWNGPKNFLVWSFWNIIKGRFLFIWEDAISLWKKVILKHKDPYDNLDVLATLSMGIFDKRSCYFKTEKTASKLDKNRYNLEDYHGQINLLQRSGIEIGLHPCYNNFKNFEELAMEKYRMEAIAGKEINSVRQHYLQFEVPITWRAQLASGFETDSTMLYPHRAGFRCGTCYQFPVFDISERKQLNLVEVPLLFMETSYLNYSNYDGMLTDFSVILEACQKYNGTLGLLWHNSNLAYKKHLKYFKKILGQLSSNS